MGSRVRTAASACVVASGLFVGGAAERWPLPTPALDHTVQTRAKAPIPKPRRKTKRIAARHQYRRAEFRQRRSRTEKPNGQKPADQKPDDGGRRPEVRRREARRREADDGKPDDQPRSRVISTPNRTSEASARVKRRLPTSRSRRRPSRRCRPRKSQSESVRGEGRRMRTHEALVALVAVAGPAARSRATATAGEVPEDPPVAPTAAGDTAPGAPAGEHTLGTGCHRCRPGVGVAAAETAAAPITLPVIVRPVGPRVGVRWGRTEGAGAGRTAGSQPSRPHGRNGNRPEPAAT